MNDFLRELETELTAASRRRSARRARPWWRRAPAPLPRPTLVAAAAMALAAIALGIAVAALRGGEDRAAQPGPAPGGTPLTALAPVSTCTGDTGPQAGADVSSFEQAMAVFRREQREPDGLSVPSGLSGDDLSWLPLARWAPQSVRRPALGQLPAPIELAPGTGSAGTPSCAERRGGTEPIVCMLTVVAGPPFGARCFTLDDVRRGRALTIVARGTAQPVVAGIVPDGVQQVELEWAGQSITAPVAENAFEATLPGAAEGTPVRVVFGDTSCQSGATEPQLRAAVPALTLQSQGQVLPPAVVGQLVRNRGVATAEARLVASSKQVRFWVVPAGTARCSDGRVAGTADRACALAATASQLLGLACVNAAGIRDGSLTFAERSVGDVVAVGVAPPGTDAAIIRTPRGTAILPATDGVVGGFLPVGVKLTDVHGSKITYRPIGKPAADAQTVTVLDASGVAGRDAAVADRLAGLARGTVAEGEVLHGVATLDPRATSVVEYAPSALDKARRVAELLGIREVRPLETGIPTAKAAIVVIVGRDLRLP